MLQSVGAWWMWSGFAVFVIAMIARGHVFPASPRRGVLWFTPLFLVLVLVELSDIVFAVDSIPAGAGLSLLLLATSRPRQDRTHPEHPVYKRPPAISPTRSAPIDPQTASGTEASKNNSDQNGCQWTGT